MNTETQTGKENPILAEITTWNFTRFTAALTLLKLSPDMCDAMTVCWCAENQAAGRDISEARAAMAGIIARTPGALALAAA